MRTPFKIFVFLFKVIIAIIFGIYGLIWFIMDGLTTHTTEEPLSFSAPLEVATGIFTEVNKAQSNTNNQGNNIESQPNTSNSNEGVNSHDANNEPILNSSDKGDVDKVLPQKTKNYQVPVQLPYPNNQQNIQPQEPASNKNSSNNQNSNNDSFINVIK